ncbi:MAG: hypothetical protein ACRCWJ_14655 [Casimicrobium sp.]
MSRNIGSVRLITRRKSDKITRVFTGVYMLIWGSYGKVSDLGHAETKHCETCEKERPFKLMLQYKVHHIWYLFKWVSSKQYLLLCDVCQRGAKLETKLVEPTLAKNPIPYSSRYGWTFLVGLIAVFIGFGVFSINERATHDAALLSEPRVHDMYVVNVSSFLQNPPSSYMYGVMKVRSVSDGNAEVVLSGVSYSKLDSATQDVATDKVATPDYFNTNTLTIPVTELQAMRSNGTMYSAHRN